MHTGEDRTVQQVKVIVNRLAFNELPEFREVLSSHPRGPSSGSQAQKIAECEHGVCPGCDPMPAIAE